MKDNILKAIDDILIVDVTPKITGRVQLSGYTDVWEGITDTRTVRKEFRISADGIFWSDWQELNVENLSNGQFVANGQFVIQLRFTRVNIKIGSIDGGNASTDEFVNTIDCSTADSVFGEGDTLYDGGGAEL